MKLDSDNRQKRKMLETMLINVFFDIKRLKK